MNISMPDRIAILIMDVLRIIKKRVNLSKVNPFNLFSFMEAAIRFELMNVGFAEHYLNPITTFIYY